MITAGNGGPAPWVGALVAWFLGHSRALPWRQAPTPYRVWVSEIMLQQTRAETVVPYFERFLRRFPTVDALAATDPQALLKVWEGLGYYSRARNLQRAAQVLVSEHRGLLPRSFAELQKLPGIGPYTAAAVASIAFGEAVPVVDGNVLRVFCRFWTIASDVRATATRRQVFDRLRAAVALAEPGTFNQAAMELGALVCRPRRPACSACPLAPDCQACRRGQTGRFPVRSPRPPGPHYDIAVGVVWKDERILIARRRQEQMLGGLWEFPGGKRAAAETLAEAAVREIAEEVGLRVAVVDRLCTVEHAYTHFRITLAAFVCAWLAGDAEPRSADELRWVRVAELEQLPFPTANRRVIAAIRQRFG